jgi:hypothetical protein
MGGARTGGAESDHESVVNRIVVREQQLRDELPQLFENPGSLLYVGAKARMHTALEMLHQAGHRITVLEAWPAYCGQLRLDPLARWVDRVVMGDVTEAIYGLPDYDVIFWFHGPEHVYLWQFEITEAKLAKMARRLVVLGAPWGKTDGGGTNPFGHHVSAHYEANWQALGYETRTIPPMDVPGGHILGWKVTGWAS